MMMRMTVKTDYMDECGVTMTMIMMLICYRSVVLFIPFGVIVLALMISCCSHVSRRLSRRLCMVSSATTVRSVSECFGSLKCSATPDFSC